MTEAQARTPAGQGPLPAWIERFEGNDNKGKPRINHFLVDPDKYMPALLKELGAERGDQYWNELAYAIMKLDFDLAVRMAKAVVPNRTITRMVRGDDGRKQRWNLTMFPKGKKDFSKMSLQERSREIRSHFRRIRGFMPV